MKKKLSCLLLTLLMVLSLMPAAAAVSDEATEAAQTLYELGLFRGTGTNPDGTPIFDLDKTPTRNQAVIMLVRLLGKEQEALNGTWELPFTDVAKGSVVYPYIGYAYANGLTNGYTTTTYCGTYPIRANQYITFVLRAMGYESGKDFEVSTAWTLSDALGITKGQYNAANAADFIRADVAKISVSALSAPLKNSKHLLADKLMAEKVFTQAQYDAVLGQTDDSASGSSGGSSAATKPSGGSSSGSSSGGSSSGGGGTVLPDDDLTSDLPDNNDSTSSSGNDSTPTLPDNWGGTVLPDDVFD